MKNENRRYSTLLNREKVKKRTNFTHLVNNRSLSFNLLKQERYYEKNTLMAIGLLLAANHAAFADEKVDSGDPCTVVLCMYGKLQGNNQSECSSAVSKFFSLSKFGRQGFDPWKTFVKRRDFLAGYLSADPAIVSDIINQLLNRDLHFLSRY